MKNLILSLITVLSTLLMVSCGSIGNKTLTKSTTDVNISGEIGFGAGDCMPSFDAPEREYAPYNGKLFFVEITALKSLGDMQYDANSTLEELKESGISTEVKDGEYSVDVTPGTYVLLIPKLSYNNKKEQIVTAVSGIDQSKDLDIWECLTY